MPRSPGIRVAAALATALAIGACSTRPDTTGAGADSTSITTERLAFQVRTYERLVALRGRLDSLRSEMPELGSPVSAPVRQRLAALDAIRDSLAAHLVALESAGDERWHTMRLEVADLLDSLEVRIGRLSDQIRRPAPNRRSRA